MAIDFTVGHWTHGPRATQLISADGTLIERKLPTKPMGAGDTFARKHPDLFLGCTGCKGTVQVMNRWARSLPTEKAVETVARTIAAKNEGTKAEDILTLIGIHLKTIILEAAT